MSDLPEIDTDVVLEDGTTGVVYRHEYELEGLTEDQIHVMTLTEDGEYDEVLTCHVEDVTVLEE